MITQNKLVKKTFTQNDRRTSIADTLKGADCKAIKLTDSTVVFRMVSDADDEVKVDDQPAIIDNANSGKVSYNWGVNDLDTPGTYSYWWIVTTNGKNEHFPGDAKMRKVIVVPVY